MYSVGTTSDSGGFYVPRRKTFDRATSWAPTSAPLPEDFDAVTYTAVTAAPAEDEVVVVVDDVDPVSTRRSHSFASGSTVPPVSSSRRRATSAAHLMNASASVGEFGEYTKEMQQVFPSARGFAVSVSKRAHHHHAPGSGRRRKGRRAPGAEYDMVRDRIVEETPEKTTTISTWRQRVADEADDKEEDMSVYYLTPRDYDAQEQEFQGESSRALSATQRRRRSSEFSSQETLGFESRLGSRRSVQTVLTEPDEAPPWMSTPPPPTSKAADQYPRPRTSSPQSNVLLPRPPRRISRSHTPIRTSTPNLKGKESPPSVPFIPTRSGSTISSIKSHATTAFQDILSSCSPSLSHIADPLQSLGINSEAHLRAISSMTEGVRDREVRDEALKKGITVMEWALLLDKIRSL